jgi:hypothetical protein
MWDIIVAASVVYTSIRFVIYVYRLVKREVTIAREFRRMRESLNRVLDEGG